jgi:hypothetical protein
LPLYALPVAMLCIGYPTKEECDRQKTSRYDEDFILFHNRYRRLAGEEFDRMYGDRASGQDSMGVLVYRRKYSAGFSIEMRRSVQAMLDGLTEG